jgi:5-methylcytosine-specific restriction protein B
MIPFFTNANNQFFRQRITTNNVYEPTLTDDVATGERFRTNIYAPTNEWAHQVASHLPEYAVQEDNKWQISGYFKKYSWARLYLKAFGSQGLYFTLGVDTGGNLVYKMDLQRQGSNKLPDEIINRLDSLMDPHDVEWHEISADELSKLNWDALVTKTVEFIQQHTELFRQLNQIIQKPTMLTSIEKSQVAAAFAAKFPNPNIILYGPPGTGKTHRTLELAYEIIKGEPPKQYADAQKLFKEEQGKQIEFVTFHQNFTYEDFVQGIKPEVNGNDQLVFKPRNGIFYEIARRAREEYQRQRPTPEAPQHVSFEDVFNRLLEPLIEQREVAIQIPMKYANSTFPITDLGTGFITFRRGQQGQLINVQNSYLQSLYEETIVLEKPTGTQIYYLYIIQRLRELAREISTAAGPAHPQANLLLHEDRREIGEQAPATPKPDDAPRNYVLIIDEINRANISKVFGELITLLEKDKRLGGDNPLSVTLPSGEVKFNVPANLYLIGTMNTADKSIALLDIALRRRFEFQALYPIYEQNDKQYFEHGEVFKKLNKEIVRLKSRDFQIGHAYFMNKEGQAAEPLGSILDKKVIPLLYEYFLNDDKKVKEALEKAGIPVHEDADTGLLRHGTTM